MRKAFLLAFGAYVALTFLLGYFWHLELFSQQYHDLALYRDQVIIPFGVTSMIIQGLFFAWAYPRLFNTERSSWLKSALRFGVVFAVFAWSFTTLPVAAKYTMTSVAEFLVLETSFTVVQFLVVSPLIALCYRDALATTFDRGLSRGTSPAAIQT